MYLHHLEDIAAALRFFQSASCCRPIEYMGKYSHTGTVPSYLANLERMLSKPAAQTVINSSQAHICIHLEVALLIIHYPPQK